MNTERESRGGDRGVRLSAAPVCYWAAPAGGTARDLSDRVGRLIEQLDEDEIIELETLLLTRQDGRP